MKYHTLKRCDLYPVLDPLPCLKILRIIPKAAPEVKATLKKYQCSKMRLSVVVWVDKIVLFYFFIVSTNPCLLKI